MSVIFKKFIFDQNKKIIEDGTRVLCEVENEAGNLNIIMLEKENLIEIGYKIPDENFNEEDTEPGKERENAELEANASTKNNADEWSDESTRFLLDKYADYLELVGPMKQFKNKKLMWMEIAKNVETVLGVQKTYIQCENRYKTILRRKRISDKNNSTFGSKRVKVNFENEIKRIASKDDSVEPEILQSANNVVVNVKDNNLLKESNKTKNTIAKCSMVEALIKIHKDKEIKKQERHAEKIALLKSCLEKENIHND